MRKLRLFAIIVLAIGITAFHSCKKDEELTNNNETKALTSTFNPNEIENMDEYLMGFMKELKNATRDSEPMTIEDAEWHLSACLNFQFCNANVGRTHVVYDTITTTINVNDGCISMVDINAAMQEISTEVNAIFDESDVENKSLLFIKPEIMSDNYRNGNSVRTVIGISGRDDEYYYFIGGFLHPEWYELYDVITENYYHWKTEAPDTLNKYINYYIPNAESTDERVYFTSITDRTFSYENYPGRLFYLVSDMCNHELTAENMMFYLDSYLGIIEENNNYIYSKISSKVTAYDEQIKESIKIRMYHEMEVQYGIPTSTNLGTN